MPAGPAGIQPTTRLLSAKRFWNELQLATSHIPVSWERGAHFTEMLTKPAKCPPNFAQFSTESAISMSGYLRGKVLTHRHVCVMCPAVCRCGLRGQNPCGPPAVCSLMLSAWWAAPLAPRFVRFVWRCACLKQERQFSLTERGCTSPPPLSAENRERRRNEEGTKTTRSPKDRPYRG